MVDCLSDGFSRVPYDCIKGVFKSDANAKPLTEKGVWPDDPEKQLSMLTCWPYGIIDGNSQKKGERNEEYKWNVIPGI